MEATGKQIKIAAILGIFLLQSCSNSRIKCTDCLELDSNLKEIIYEFNKNSYFGFDYYISIYGLNSNEIVLSKEIDPSKYPLFNSKDTTYMYDKYCYISDKLIVLTNIEDSYFVNKNEQQCNSEVTLVSKKNLQGDFVHTSFLDWIVLNTEDTIYVYENIISEKSLIKSIVK